MDSIFLHQLVVQEATLVSFSHWKFWLEYAWNAIKAPSDQPSSTVADMRNGGDEGLDQSIG